MSGRKIIEGLKDAVAGNFTRVTIEGQTWVRQDTPTAINIRVGKAEKNRLKDAAKTKGVSLSEFLRYAAVTEAHRVLGPPHIVRLEGEVKEPAQQAPREEG